MTKKPKIPVILYEETPGGERQNPIPFIEVEQDDTMPPVLFVFEYRDTGETEPGDEGQDLPVVEQIPHQYIDMQFMKEKTSPELYDQLRVALGMQTLKEAQKEGQKILDKVFTNLQVRQLPVLDKEGSK